MFVDSPLIACYNLQPLEVDALEIGNGHTTHFHEQFVLGAGGCCRGLLLIASERCNEPNLSG